MEIKLVVVGGDAPEKEFSLELPAVIGRQRDADVTLAHPLISRRHCELYQVNESLVVKDLDSLNGTYIGEKRITEDVLPAGGLLTVGAVTFRAVYGRQGDEAEQDTFSSTATETRSVPNIGERVERPGETTLMAGKNAPPRPPADDPPIDDVEVLDD
jgi:pSer/pThr/pTyr-binding forkhead associated (FHA) protein